MTDWRLSTHPRYIEICLKSRVQSGEEMCLLRHKKGKQNIPGRVTSRSRSQPPTPGGREKMTQTNVSTANKQMHDKHKDQPYPPLSPSKATKTPEGQKQHTDREQGKTKHEAPRSANHRATQNKNNIGTTAP